jgi:hypothetical protein
MNYNPTDPLGANAPVRFYSVVSDDGYRMGEIKVDRLRESRQFTALGHDGSRIKDCHTEDEAFNLILNQDVDTKDLKKDLT